MILAAPRRRPRWMWLGGALGIAFAFACGCGVEVVPDCAPDEYDAFGACVPLGCGGEGVFGSFTGADVVFVHARSDSHGWGTEEAPFRSIAVGVADAVSQGETHVVVAEGTYIEQIFLGPEHTGIQIHGVCTDEVIVVGNLGGGVVVDGDADTEVHVEALTLEITDGIGAAVFSGSLTLDDVAITSPRGMGIVAIGEDAVVDLTDVTITGTRSIETLDGVGLGVWDGATATASRLMIEDSEVAAVYAEGDQTSVVLLGSEIRGTPLGVEPGSDPEVYGAGALAYDGAAMTLIDTLVVDVWQAGFEMDGGGSGLLERSTVSGILPDPTLDVAIANGIGAFGGASVIARDTIVERATLIGVVASGPGSIVDLQGGEVGYSTPPADIVGAGLGLYATDGARIEGLDLVVEEATVAGGAAVDATLRLTDTVIRRTLPTLDDPYGIGLLAQEDGILDLFRVTVTGSNTLGVLIAGGSADLTAVDVSDTVRGGGQTTAIGVAVFGISHLDALDLTVTATEGPAVVVSGQSEAECDTCILQDSTFAGLVVADEADVAWTLGTIAQTAVDAGQGGGVGIHVQGIGDGPVVAIEDTVVRDSPHAAVHVVGIGDVRLDRNVLIGGPALREVWPRGTAVFATGSLLGTLTLTDNTIQDSEGAGVFLDGATATLLDNVYDNNAVDLIQQLCDASIPIPIGLDTEAVDVVELCPPFDRPVESFVYTDEASLPEIDG